ncbi:hypothetical protein H0H93_003845, partial [Arthromyces matolae]
MTTPELLARRGSLNRAPPRQATPKVDPAADLFKNKLRGTGRLFGGAWKKECQDKENEGLGSQVPVKVGALRLDSAGGGSKGLNKVEGGSGSAAGEVDDGTPTPETGTGRMVGWKAKGLGILKGVQSG